MPLVMAACRLGHSADGSVADTMSALAPLVIAAWMAGICEDGVAAVPLVSEAVSPSVCRAAMAPPEFTLSAVVKYGLPRFFGMMKTFSPVFSDPEAPDPDPEEADAEELAGPLPDEPHAASVAEATRSTAGAHRALFIERLICESFQSEPCE